MCCSSQVSQLPEVLHRGLQSLVEVRDVVDNILVVDLSSLQQLQLLQHFALHHRNRVLRVVLAFRRLFQQVLHDPANQHAPHC